MKKTLTFLALTLLFLGCSEDEPTPASLVGTWVFTSHVSSNCADPKWNNTDTCSDSSCFEIVISATSITSDTEVFTYTTSGNNLTATEGGLTLEFTYSISGSILTLTSQDSPAEGGCKNVETYTRKG